MFKVFIKGLEFYAFHGVTAEEQAIGHRYIADLSLDVTGDATETDEIAGTVDYAIAGNTALSILTRGNYKTMERTAALACDALLRVFPAVSRVEISLAKRLPPTHLIAAEAGVIVVRTREQHLPPLELGEV